MTQENAPLTKCCNGCPFLAVNAGRPNPNGWVPDPTKGEYDWYAQKNLDRLWNDGLRHGEFMVCHSNDPTASTYGGTDSKQEPKLCVGSLVAQASHIRAYESILSETPNAKPAPIYRLYKLQAGKTAMSQKGLRNAAFGFALRRSDLMGGLPIPARVDEDRPFRVPTGDVIITEYTKQ